MTSNHNNFVLELVTWVDAFGCSPSWSEIDELTKNPPEVLKCQSVGWVAYEDENHIVVVPHIANADNKNGHRNRQGYGGMTIPKSAIVERAVLDVKTFRTNSDDCDKYSLLLEGVLRGRPVEISKARDLLGM